MIDCLTTILVSLVVSVIAPPDRPLVHEAVIEAPIAEVWTAWATERGLESWLAKSAKVNLEPGGRYATNGFAEVGKPGTVEMQVIAFDPGHMLAFTTSAPPDAFPEVADAEDTWAVVSLSAIDEAHTRVVYSMLGWREGDEWDEARQFFEQANAYVLSLLEQRFAGEHEPLTATRTSVRSLSHAVEVDASPEIAWEAITERDGLATWLGDVSDVDLRLGGLITIGEGDAPTYERILAFDPGRVLVTQLDIPSNLETTMGSVEDTWIVTRIEPLPEGKTRVTRTMLGWGSGPEWRTPRLFFETRLRQQVRDLGRALIRRSADLSSGEPATSVIRGEKVLSFMTDSLVGVWEAEVVDPEGVPTTIRNDIRVGPGNNGLVISGWFNARDELRLHASTLIWLDHTNEQTRFQSLDETGSVAQGEITLDNDAVVWDWRSQAPDGTATVYRMVMTLERRWEYTLQIFEIDGADIPILEALFTRARRLPTSAVPTGG